MSNALRIVHKNRPAPEGRREHPARFWDLHRSGGELNLSLQAGSVIRRFTFHLSAQMHKTSYYCKEYKDQRNIKSLFWPSFCYAVGVIAACGVRLSQRKRGGNFHMLPVDITLPAVFVETLQFGRCCICRVLSVSCSLSPWTRGVTLSPKL